jgi:hypothetical protein
LQVLTLPRTSLHHGAIVRLLLRTARSPDQWICTDQMNRYFTDVHGLPSCDFLVPTLYGKLSNPSAILLEIGHARENIDKFTAKGEGKVA